MKKISKFIILPVFLILILLMSYMWLSFKMNLTYVPASPEKGFHSPYYLYIPSGVSKQLKEGTEVTFLLQPNNSGRTSDDHEMHRKDAWWMAFGRHFLADELNVVLVVPTIIRPATDWHIYTHAIDRDVFTTDRKELYRPDLQVLAMIDDARDSLELLGFKTRSKFLVQGFSASGMFANRLTLLHPDRILASASGSPGGWPIAPISNFKGRSLVWPAGISDYQQLTGKTFDSSYFHVPQLIVMGDQDDNDSLDFTDGWEPNTAEIVEQNFGESPIDRWTHSKKLYEGTKAKFVLVEGVGHDRKALQSYTTDFFKEVLAK